MNKAWHFAPALGTAVVAMLILARSAAAHPGHGGLFGSGALHYLTSLGHLLPVVVIGILTGLGMIASRRIWLMRGGGRITRAVRR